jgi:8-oxo-dGTP pyrophosphatase MutT (NUDIX family)
MPLLELDELAAHREVNMSIKPWKILSSRYLITDRWLTLRADRCEGPAGILVDPYYVQELPDWVQVVAFDDEERVLVTRQYRHGAAVVSSELPCGTVEVNESPSEAVLRELMEETGCVPRTLRLLQSLSPNPARYTNEVHTFVATGVRQVQAQRLDDTEEIEFEFMPIDRVLAAIDDGTFPQALHVAGLLLALRRRSSVGSGPM